VAPDPGAVDPRDVVDTIAMMARPEDVLVCDASLASGWGAAFYPIRQPGRRFLAPRGLAGIGWAGPAAIGAQSALGQVARVFALIGDGAWGYSLADVETAVRRELPVVFVILNNHSLAWVQHGRVADGKSLSCEFAETNFAAVADAFGATGIRVGPHDDLEAAFAAALRSGGPGLVEVESSKVLSPILSPPDDPALGVADDRDAYGR
jgi:acetolactate synthase-1/2/3 large subunit